MNLVLLLGIFLSSTGLVLTELVRVNKYQISDYSSSIVNSFPTNFSHHPFAIDHVSGKVYKALGPALLAVFDENLYLEKVFKLPSVVEDDLGEVKTLFVKHPLTFFHPNSTDHASSGDSINPPEIRVYLCNERGIVALLIKEDTKPHVSIVGSYFVNNTLVSLYGGSSETNSRFFVHCESKEENADYIDVLDLNLASISKVDIPRQENTDSNDSSGDFTAALPPFELTEGAFQMIVDAEHQFLFAFPTKIGPSSSNIAYSYKIEKDIREPLKVFSYINLSPLRNDSSSNKSSLITFSLSSDQSPKIVKFLFMQEGSSNSTDVKDEDAGYLLPTLNTFSIPASLLNVEKSTIRVPSACPCIIQKDDLEDIMKAGQDIKDGYNENNQISRKRIKSALNSLVSVSFLTYPQASEQQLQRIKDESSLQKDYLFLVLSTSSSSDLHNSSLGANQASLKPEPRFVFKILSVQGCKLLTEEEYGLETGSPVKLSTALVSPANHRLYVSLAAELPFGFLCLEHK